MNFYVYEHWRPDRDECFYVGKGRGKRANAMYGRNRYHKFIQDKLSKMGLCVEVRIYKGQLTEEESFKIEVERIAFWKSYGIDLVNLTDGGEGQFGRRLSEDAKKRIGESSKARNAGIKHSDATKRKMSEAAKGRVPHNKGKKLSPEQIERLRQANIGRRLSDEIRVKMSLAHKGRKHSPEAIENMRAAKRKWWSARKAKSECL